MSKLYLYADSLPPDAKTRYMDKFESIDGLDPFSSDFVGEKSDVVPPVSGCDLVSYLVLQTSFITSKQFKAHKSLEAYNQFVSGWVKDIQTHIVSVDIAARKPFLRLCDNSSSYSPYWALTLGILYNLVPLPTIELVKHWSTTQTPISAEHQYGGHANVITFT